MLPESFKGIAISLIIVLISCVTSGAIEAGSCYKCAGRGYRNSPAYKLCYRVTEDTDVVPCIGGCGIAYGEFENGQNSIERWCVDSEEEMKSLFAMVSTRTRKEKLDGKSFACDSITFDTDDDQYKRGPLIYEYCWCKGEKCNGNAANRMVRSEGSGSSLVQIRKSWIGISAILIALTDRMGRALI